MLPNVYGASGASDVSGTHRTDGTGCENREQNGQEIRFASLDAAANAGAIAVADAGSDAVPDVRLGCNRDTEDRRAARALRELRMSVPGGRRVPGVPVVDVVAVVGYENREENGQGLQNESRDLVAGTPAGTPAGTRVNTRVNTPDTGLDSNRDQGRAVEDDRSACSGGPVRTLTGYVYLRAPQLQAGTLFVVCVGAIAGADAVRVCFLGLNQDVENPRPTVRPKFGGVSLAAALPAHPLSVLSMLFSRKIANKTEKEFKMQIGKHLGKRRDAILGKHGKHHSQQKPGAYKGPSLSLIWWWA